ncbi:amidase family protein [Nocardia jinanensis]|uniref:Amidase n=1 Tax=Nocardia jinanensis TaxID=382504 RepID=A0A917VW78_9NOCA|nr:amidase family protein [Nocardia jinanensis]GGL32590.1 amidase [Nocardia jinanensis]
MTGVAAEPGIDTSVWRVTGSPLVAATAAGPLSGRIVAVKDLFAVAGFPIGAGVPVYQREQPAAPRHADAVARLLSAGAQVGGIARTDEFAYSLTGGNGGFGMPVNPAAPDRIPGGSTSGPAVAVARGEADIGLGTDTAGSIRVPAAYQGLWGIRTTSGRVDTSGLLPLAQSFDTVGWLARDGATLAEIADCVLGADTAACTGFAVDPAVCGYADPELAAVVGRAADRLDAVPVDLRPADSWLVAFRIVQAFEAWRNHGEWVAAHPGVLEPEVADRFAFAATVTAAQAAAAREVLAAAMVTLRSTIGDRALLLPTVATPPPPRAGGPQAWEHARARTLRLTCLASIAGLPAVTVPLRSGAGIPVGLCLLGASGTDRSLIRLALSSVAVPAGGSLHSEDRP